MQAERGTKNNATVMRLIKMKYDTNTGTMAPPMGDMFCPLRMPMMQTTIHANRGVTLANLANADSSLSPWTRTRSTNRVAGSAVAAKSKSTAPTLEEPIELNKYEKKKYTYVTKCI
jgi:hypothetical protein